MSEKVTTTLLFKWPGVNKLTIKLDSSGTFATSLHPRHFGDYFNSRSLKRIFLLSAWTTIWKIITPCTFQKEKKTERGSGQGPEPRWPSCSQQTSSAQVLLIFTTQFSLLLHLEQGLEDLDSSVQILPPKSANYNRFSSQWWAWGSIWFTCQPENVVSCIYSFRPPEGECYSLHTLLIHIQMQLYFKTYEGLRLICNGLTVKRVWDVDFILITQRGFVAKWCFTLIVSTTHWTFCN